MSETPVLTPSPTPPPGGVVGSRANGGVEGAPLCRFDESVHDLKEEVLNLLNCEISEDADGDTEMSDGASASANLTNLRERFSQLGRRTRAMARRQHHLNSPRAHVSFLRFGVF